jgi:hypothetical protein
VVVTGTEEVRSVRIIGVYVIDVVGRDGGGGM